MKKAEAVALLDQWEACPEAMDRLGKHRSVAKMIDAATYDDLEWVLSQIGDAAWAEYRKARGPAWAEYEKVCGPAARKILLAWCDAGVLP